MKNFDYKWQQLTARARLAPRPADEPAPYGFATRVAARAFRSRPAGPWSLLEKFALRGLVATTALGVASLAFSFPTFAGETEDELALATDPVPELLDLS